MRWKTGQTAYLELDDSFGGQMETKLSGVGGVGFVSKRSTILDQESKEMMN